MREFPESTSCLNFISKLSGSQVICKLTPDGQFFVKSNEGLSGAKDLSETIASWSMLIGIILGGIIGYKVDGRNKRTIPWFIGCFLFRCLGLFFMTVVIDDYRKQK